MRRCFYVVAMHAFDRVVGTTRANRVVKDKDLRGPRLSLHQYLYFVIVRLEDTVFQTIC
jgi:hypothetical protein